MAKTLPFSGLHIAVTRPREQAIKLARGIETLGGICILFPLLEISPLAEKHALYALAARLHKFQLAIFISPNAVRYGMEAILDAGGLPASLQIATVGQSSARALHAYGIKQVIAPQFRFDSEALLSLPELREVNGKHVVIFRGDKGRELLGDTLKQRGATVEYATCYHRSKPQHGLADLLAIRPDALTVSSSEALENLREMANKHDWELLLSIPLFVSHERIAVAARTLGWQNIATAGGGDGDLLSELVVWAEHIEVQKQ